MTAKEKNGMSAEESIAVARRIWQEIVDDGDLSVVDDLVAEEYVYRGPGGLELHGPAGFRRFIGSLHQLFGEIEVTVHEYIADRNRVLSRWTGHGTHRESRREVTWRGATLTRVAGERWSRTGNIGTGWSWPSSLPRAGCSGCWSRQWSSEPKRSSRRDNDASACHPQDMEPDELAEVVELTRVGRLVEAWRLMRVEIADERRHPPLGPPYNPVPNNWALYAEGTTYFLPVSELTHVLLNVLPALVNEEHGFFFADERNYFRPAGLEAFAKSDGGHLDDNPHNGKVFPWGHFERLNTEFCAVEQGIALQNLGLACQAMGLSGFPHYAFHDEAWFEALGFRMSEMPISDFMDAGLIPSAVMRLKGQDVEMGYPLGLEREGEVLLKAYCPPYFESMEAAVRAAVTRPFIP